MPAYGYGGPPPMREPAWTPEQQWQNDQRDQQDAYNRWLQAQSLGMQLAGQQYQNAAQGVQNANTISSARQSRAGTRYGLGNDVAGMDLRIAQALTDLAQQGLANHRYGFNLDLDLAQILNREQPGYGSRAAALFRG
jgi:hypothetical protein